MCIFYNFYLSINKEYTIFAQYLANGGHHALQCHYVKF